MPAAVHNQVRDCASIALKPRLLAADGVVFPRPSIQASITGVNSSVSGVAMIRPPTMAVDKANRHYLTALNAELVRAVLPPVPQMHTTYINESKVRRCRSVAECTLGPHPTKKDLLLHPAGHEGCWRS